LDKHGHITLAGFKYLERLGKSKLLTAPHYHPVLGLDAYTKVTSPLRRYGDMISHWQIEAALREESKMDSSNLTSTKRQDYLPFSKSAMENINTRLLPREKLITNAKMRSINHWISHFFYRAHYFKEYEFPDRFPVIIFRTAPDYRRDEQLAWCVMMDTGIKIKAIKVSNPLHGELLIEGDIWEAEIANATPYRPDVRVNCIRLISREP